MKIEWSELTRLSPEEIATICADTYRYMGSRILNSSNAEGVDLKDMSLVLAGIEYYMLNEYVQMNGVESVDSLYGFMHELFNNTYKFVKEGGGQ